MTLTEKKELISTMAKNGWWKDEYVDCFAEDIKIEYPFAPPGMMQDLYPAQVIAHRRWLNRTVKTWNVEIEKVLGPKEKNDNQFFITCNITGTVCWGGHDGEYRNRTVAKVLFKGDKIWRVRQWFNPFQLIWAAGREIPTFHVSLDWHNDLRKLLPTEQQETPVYDLSPEACKARREDNIKRFQSTEPGYAWNPVKVSDDYLRYVWFVPPEMKDTYPPEEVTFMEMWSNASCDNFEYLPGTVVYETEDPHEIYFESSATGMYHWEGNNSYGGYLNRYLLHIEVNDKGFCTRYDEYLNPINKMNSINQSIPTFPWLY